jgi:SAM-dependent methyltransferase
MWLGEHLLPLLERYGLKTGSVLDVGCGTGRAFEPLLSRGWKVVGCDLSGGMLSVAEEKYGDRVSLVRADARDLPSDFAARHTSSPGGFELILMLNDVANYYLDDGDLDQAFAGFSRSLEPSSGLVLFDLNTLRLFAADYSSDVRDERGGGWSWQGLSRLTEVGGIFEGRFSGPGVEDHLHVQRHWSPMAVRSALGRSGLELLAAIGQREDCGRLELAEPPDEDRDEKVIYIARALAQEVGISPPMEA